ncbi:hypothetical protein EV361DRAFT_405682 [Lentinula raphanica]|uniref:Secreted protein n=1 Tax=Lentinula raphanica TaxID=153919 RepID=A0AA38NZB0_9AGAR|nr:hypothetical protein F5878DRAFT_665771 [Lentinula raphanica]KAJ3968648.1 hypothetical protein EV361DRAFT_405682 [Lentinula raphanica]
MTRPTKSRVLAILVLGAAISSSVLAAPASIPPPPPLSRPSTNPSTNLFSTEAQPSLHSRAVGQTASEVATLRGRRVEDANFVPRRDGSDLTAIDDPKYGSDFGKDATRDVNNVAVSVNLKQRTDHSPVNEGGLTDEQVVDMLMQESKEIPASYLHGVHEDTISNILEGHKDEIYRIHEQLQNTKGSRSQELQQEYKAKLVETRKAAVAAFKLYEENRAITPNFMLQISDIYSMVISRLAQM